MSTAHKNLRGQLLANEWDAPLPLIIQAMTAPMETQAITSAICDRLERERAANAERRQKIAAKEAARAERARTRAAEEAHAIAAHTTWAQSYNATIIERLVLDFKKKIVAGNYTAMEGSRRCFTITLSQRIDINYDKDSYYRHRAMINEEVRRLVAAEMGVTSWRITVRNSEYLFYRLPCKPADSIDAVGFTLLIVPMIAMGVGYLYERVRGHVAHRYVLQLHVEL
jgi:hypothetical protein